MLTLERLEWLRRQWTEDCRALVPDFELLDEERMLAEIERVRGVCGMHGCPDLEVVVHVLRSQDEEKSRVPGPWWWITASLLILPDIVAHPWYEACWWVYQDMRGMRELTTIWGSASVSKTSLFAALALTNMVVWHGDCIVRITSPYKNAGADKIWRALTKRTDYWALHPPEWVAYLGLTITSNREEIIFLNAEHQESSATFVALENTASIQGLKRDRVTGQKRFDPRRGVLLLVGDELIINPMACANFAAGEGNLVANSNVQSWLGMNPVPQQVKHPNAISFSAPTEVGIDTLNEHQSFTWRTMRGRLLRFCMANSPNRFAEEPVFDFLINEEQAVAATKRGEDNYRAQVIAWGFGSGTGNGGVLTMDAVNTPAWQPAPTWGTPPSRIMFADLAFGGTDPAGFVCLDIGQAVLDRQNQHVISGVEHDRIHVERHWMPTKAEIAEFKKLALDRGGEAPPLEPDVEVQANALMVFNVLKTAARLGVGKGRVSFDSSLRPDVTIMMIKALGSVPWFYSGSRKLSEEEATWPLWPPETNPDGTPSKWSDKHRQIISAAWRFSEHVIVRGHVRGLGKLRKGCTELLSRQWVEGTSNRKDVEAKAKLSVSPMWAETLALGLVFAVRFCGALPQLANEKPLTDGSPEDLLDDSLFQIRSRKILNTWAQR